MLKKKIISLSLVLLSTLSITSAQVADGAFGYYNDALLFSRTYDGGTARMQGIGGAQVSLGGDINAAYANPAGLGSIRRSSMAMTMALDFNNTRSQYFDTTTDGFKANFNIANLGMAFSMLKEANEPGAFRGGTFAITVTRKNNFHSNYRYGGYNDTEVGKSSIVDSYLDRAWGIPEDDLQGDLFDAYNQYLINPYIATDSQTGQDFTAYDKFIGDFPFQEENVLTRGAQYEWDFSGGANINDIFFFGAGLGISTINYYTESTYTESDFLYNGQPDHVIDFYSTRNTLRVNGTGISGKFGIIARPAPFVRLGATVNTPTYYGMREKSSEDFWTVYNELIDNPDYEYYDEYLSNSRYSLVTPWKFTTGASIFIGKRGFLSADVDFINYAESTLQSNDFEVDADNTSIQNLYTNTINFRIGGEFRINQFMLRGGYGIDGDPYIDSSIDNSIQRISGGIGYKNEAFFIDLSVVHTHYDSQRSPYTIYSFDDPTDNISPVATISNNNLNVALTAGFSF
ncbi:hypothetical protein BFP72_15745 [Reichenbachiella sp. 5M10]|uniref:OmpP1/FadL family transporter n=1 Tax=Reichenbachiella sp. 5M10 TaxID=1889772 RepID=UPI000C1490A8|nr:hypothetical protein [Reichenbachiella sp. 5M10]PIB36748.1 hypothetical protein BFP72_15745 [Reichenbachiella sp. 5M10]